MNSGRFDQFTRLLAGSGTRRQAFGVALAGGLSRFTHWRQNGATPDWNIVIDEITGQKIEGEVTHSDTTMRFRGWLDQMPCVMAQSPDGSEIFAIKRDGADVVTTLAESTLQTRTPLAEAKSARKLLYPELQIERVHAVTTVDGTVETLQEIASRPEYALMPGLSFALGALGATGRNYPPAMPIHAVGLAAAVNLGIDPDTEQATYSFRMRGSTAPVAPVERVQNQEPETSTLQPTVLQDQEVAQLLNNQLQTNPCYNAAVPQDCRGCKGKPNQDDCCYGMCGPCCTCWDRVCGDCCYHQFCADHDSVLGQCDGASDVLSCIAAYFPANFIVEGCDGELF